MKKAEFIKQKAEILNPCKVNEVPEEITNKEVQNDSINVKPWAHSKYDNYNQNTKGRSFYVSKILINEHSLNTLLSEAELNDEIMNGFLQLLKFKYPGRNPLVFDLHFFGMLTENRKTGYMRWAMKNEVQSYDVWVLPKGGGGHWSLIIVIFSQRLIIHLDSAHFSLDNRAKQLLCDFIENLFFAKGLKIEWDLWTFYSPKDIPKQGFVIDGQEFLGVNCGVHVCVWAHIILSGQIYDFTEEDMDRVRKWIHYELLEADGKNIENTLRSIKMMANFKLTNLKEKANLRKMKNSTKPPAGATSTLLYCQNIKHIACNEGCDNKATN